MGKLNKLIKERVQMEQRSNGNALAPPPERNPTFKYNPLYVALAVFEEERSGVLIKSPADFADMDMDWRNDMGTVRERLQYERDRGKYPAELQPMKRA